MVLTMNTAAKLLDAQTRVMEGQSWSDFCRALEAAGDIVLARTTPASPIDRAEGYRYLTRLTRIGLEMMLEHADPDFPTFYAASHPTGKIGGDNPDNLYQNATIAGDREYRIYGRRNTVPYLSFGTKANRYATEGTMASTGELEAAEMVFGKDGSFEIAVSRERKAGNWLPLAADTSMLLVRQTFLDRANEVAADVRIERVGGPARPEPLTPQKLDRGLASAAAFVTGTARTFVNWVEEFRKYPNAFAPFPQETCYRTGGDPLIYYLHGYWQLAADEALVIDNASARVRDLELPARQLLDGVAGLSLPAGVLEQAHGEIQRGRNADFRDCRARSWSRQLHGYRGPRLRFHAAALDAREDASAAALPGREAGKSRARGQNVSMYLEDIERIRQLKYRYFRGIDTADIELLRGVLAEDVHIDYHGGTYRWQVEGREAMLTAIAASFNEHAVACHTGHHPEIEVLTPTTATGIWYLTDVFINLREKLVTTGSALYRDEYVKQADGWRIKSSTYKRLYEIQEALESAPKLTAHYLANAAGREAIARATTR